VGVGRCSPIGGRSDPGRRWPTLARSSAGQREWRRLSCGCETAASVVRDKHAEKDQGETKVPASDRPIRGVIQGPSASACRGPSEA
jgi:hypothetical protein